MVGGEVRPHGVPQLARGAGGVHDRAEEGDPDGAAELAHGVVQGGCTSGRLPADGGEGGGLAGREHVAHGASEQQEKTTHLPQSG